MCVTLRHIVSHNMGEWGIEQIMEVAAAYTNYMYAHCRNDS